MTTQLLIRLLRYILAVRSVRFSNDRNGKRQLPRFRIDSDYYQFHIRDGYTQNGALGEAWTAEALKIDVAVAAGIIGVGTVRNTSVAVSVEVLASPPDVKDLDSWDRVIDASIAIPSGNLELTSPTWEDRETVAVAPGNYRIRIHSGNIVAAQQPGSRLRERYKVLIWPGDMQPVAVIKNLEQS